MSNQLKGKVALITGGSRGLGAAIAGLLADQGADVAISYVASAEKAEAVVEKLKAKGARARHSKRSGRHGFCQAPGREGSGPLR